ncbi:hypothetical protein [Hoeflea prorocentri]|uniref:Uncharacterized protein n=1 Tax=Hoeflea prorocentri TaxID=1922333 RepID=A0A9X3ZJR6_9HYPH|nr:hypothetical protein [Hoeflea prorocentri]MCY6383085.1 hypothetical protein [Hoeflea prorocentri]MDA5400885.1 hypothetical protein [Hoeflea prorocentri]
MKRADSISDDLATIVDFHLSLGRDKCVSYLPINTINNVLNKTTEAMCQQAMRANLKCMVFDDGSCWVKGGAVYFYSESELSGLIRKHRNLLDSLGWEANCEDVVAKIAAEYFEADHAVMPFIVEAFGDDLILR